MCTLHEILSKWFKSENELGVACSRHAIWGMHKVFWWKNNTLRNYLEKFLLLQSALQPFWVFGLLNYRWVFSAGRLLQSAVASGTSNPQPGGPVIRTFQLSPQEVPSVWRRKRTPVAEGGKCREFCRKCSLPRHFWVLLHAVDLRYGTDGFTALRIFSPEKSDGFGRVWTRELGYQRRSPLDHRSRYLEKFRNPNIIWVKY
jgi:hypothetical protein